LSTADLAEGSVETDAAPHGDRGAEASRVRAARRHEGSGGDEGVDRELSGGVLDRAELCDRPATDGDDETVPASGAPQVRGEVAA
jgi:hypothetical protein